LNQPITWVRIFKTASMYFQALRWSFAAAITPLQVRYYRLSSAVSHRRNRIGSRQ
jgi:hypothetical protein